MYKIEFNILDLAKIDLYTNMESIYEFMKFEPNKLAKTIPVSNIVIEKADDSNMCIRNFDVNKIVLKNSHIKGMYYNKNNNVSYMFSPENDMRFPDLVYTLIMMFSNILIKKDKYFIHSSSIKYDEDKSILLVGDANSGKSSLALKLMEKYGYKLISNDHTLIGLENGLLTSYIGTKELELREGVLKRDFNNHYKYLNLPENSDCWSNKMIINNVVPNYLISDDDNTTITDIFQIDVISKGDTFITKKELVDQRLYLYEQLTKIIKGTYNLITGFSYPMPSLENQKVLKKTDEQICKALENTNIYIAKGTLTDLADGMVKILEKK